MELNEGQKRILKEALEWFKNPFSDQVFEIDGLAGTGKSVLIYHILKELNLSTDQYMPMAYTGQASIVMRTKGFHTARSIHSSLYEVIEVYDRDDINSVFGKPKKKVKFRLRSFIDPNVKLFFIDEGYMVPENIVKDILSFGIKVIVSGDEHQLPPVGYKPAFFTGKWETHHLTELMRQSLEDPIIYLANSIIRGDVIHKGIYGNSVMIIDDYEFIPQMIGYADIIITGTNRTRDNLNSYVRNIAGFHSKFPKYGERLICRNNNWDTEQDGIALANGLIGTVISEVDMNQFNGQTFMIDFIPDIANTVFQNVNVNYQYFTGSFDDRNQMRDYNVRRYMTGQMFEYAYAITTHLSQGGEFDKGIIIKEYLHPQLQKQLEYTAITRFKKSCIIVHKTDRELRLPK
jgi:exodeoxyribonuclease-5